MKYLRRVKKNGYVKIKDVKNEIGIKKVEKMLEDKKRMWSDTWFELKMISGEYLECNTRWGRIGKEDRREHATVQSEPYLRKKGKAGTRRNNRQGIGGKVKDFHGEEENRGRRRNLNSCNVRGPIMYACVNACGCVLVCISILNLHTNRPVTKDMKMVNKICYFMEWKRGNSYEKNKTLYK